jgi:hypothetical protein
MTVSTLRSAFCSHATLLAGVTGTLMACSLAAQTASTPHTDSERKEICVVSFMQDKIYPAKVPDSAAACMDKAAKALAAAPDSILVLIGTADITKDWSKNGNMRDIEDATGKDLRFWDIAAYRSIDTKAYLAQWSGADPKRIAARTAYTVGQEVGIYLVTQGTDLRRVFPKTVLIFEYPCTMKPCPRPEEEDMHPIHRTKIGAH